MLSEAELTLQKELERLNNACQQSQHAESTQQAYGSDWQQFIDYCLSRGLMALPAEDTTVALYLMHLHKDKGRARTTIMRHLASVSAQHQQHYFRGFNDSVRVQQALKGIRTQDNYSTKQAQPLLFKDLLKLLSVIDQHSLKGKRDITLLSWLWFGAFRKSELVRLNIEHLEYHRSKGFLVTLKRSKTNRENTKVQQLPIPLLKEFEFCPVLLLKKWLHHTGISEGPLFRPLDKEGYLDKGLSVKSIDQVLRNRLKEAGLAGFTPHSFRAGFLTEAAQAGASKIKLQEVSQHTSNALERYVRPVKLFENPAAVQIIRSVESFFNTQHSTCGVT